MADDALASIGVEVRRVYWVLELTRRGMTEARAELLVASPVDPHAVRDALDSGCPPETAWEIWNVEPVAARRVRTKNP